MTRGRLIGWSALTWIVAFALLGVASSPPAIPFIGTNQTVEGLAHLLGPSLMAALLTGWFLEARGLGHLHAALLGAVSSALVVTATEVAQLGAPGRSVETIDIALSIIGSVVGAVLYVVATGFGRDRLVAPTLAGLTALAVVMAAVAFVTQPVIRHVCLGEAPTVAPADDGPTTTRMDRVTEGVVVEYRFAEGSGTRTAARGGVSQNADLTLLEGAEWLDHDGVSLETPTAAVRSAAPASVVVDAVLESGEFTIEAWVIPDRLQDGPARIVTISDGTAFDGIDVQIAQERTCLSHRIRFGDELEWVVVEGVFADIGLRHLIVTFQEGVTRSYVNGRLIDVHKALDHRPHGWNPGNHLLVGNEESLDRIFLGDVFLVAVYDRQFSDREVTANFLSGPRPAS